MPGRPRKPTAVLKMQGTARKHRHANRRDLELGGDLPQPPEFLSEIELAEWHRVCTIGRYAKVLSHADRGPLTFYVGLWGEYLESRQTKEKMQTSRMALFFNIAKSFGMDPCDRAKVQLPEAPKDKNPFAELDEAEFSNTAVQ